MAINNPYVPGDPFSYDLNWIVEQLNRHSASIQANSDAIESLEERMPTLEEIKKYLQDAVAAGRLSYVTPEMFGAVGNGVNDDTEAFQNTVDVNVPIVCSPGKTYKLHEITLKDGSDLNANGSEFIALDPRLFVAEGEAVNYGATAAAYQAGERSISLSVNPETGNLLHVVDETYTYRSQDGVDFKAGGLCEVETEAGAQPTIMPSIQFDLAFGSSVTEYKPITVKISNIGNVIFDDVPNCVAAIYLVANKGSVIENVNMNGAFRSAVALNYCYQTTIMRCECLSTYIPPELYYYIIAVGGSSYRTIIDSCDLQSTWNVISDVGYTPVLNTIISNSVLKCSTNYPAYLAHCCAIDMLLTNCSIDGLQLANSATVENCHIYDRGDGGFCTLAILADEDPTNTWEYRILNTVFHGPTSSAGGIRVASNTSGTIHKLYMQELVAAEGLDQLKLTYAGNLTTIKEMTFDGFIMDLSAINNTHVLIESLEIINCINYKSFIVADDVLHTVKFSNYSQYSTGSEFVVPCSVMQMDNARFFNDTGVAASIAVRGLYSQISNMILDNAGRVYVSATAEVYITNSTFTIASLALGRKLSAFNCNINGNLSTDIMIDQSTGQLYYHRLNNGAIQLIAIN